VTEPGAMGVVSGLQHFYIAITTHGLLLSGPAGRQEVTAIGRALTQKSKRAHNEEWN
jgi:hypothetical protein